MKTLYYYVKWLFKDFKFKFDSTYIVFLATIFFIIGIIMNVMGMMIHTEIDPVTHQLKVWRDEYWPLLGDKFLITGMLLYIIFVFWHLVIQNFRRSFQQFKQEQKDLLKTIDRGRR
jgi:uncharacterized BrkB/YihY/UPF0761 family membrane protein